MATALVKMNFLCISGICMLTPGRDYFSELAPTVGGGVNKLNFPFYLFIFVDVDISYNFQQNRVNRFPHNPKYRGDVGKNDFFCEGLDIS